MTPLEATNAILNHAIASSVTVGDVVKFNGATLTFDGERFDAPEGEPWIRLTIRDLPTASVTLGARANRLAERRATLIAQVFAPLEVSDGAGAALALAIAFRDLFEPADVTASAGVVHITGGATVRRVGVDGAWYQVNVDVPLTYHETI